MARAQVWMNPRVLEEQGVLMTHSFNFRDSLSCRKKLLAGSNENVLVMLGASLHDVAVDN